MDRSRGKKLCWQNDDVNDKHHKRTYERTSEQTDGQVRAFFPFFSIQFIFIGVNWHCLFVAKNEKGRVDEKPNCIRCCNILWLLV